MFLLNSRYSLFRAPTTRIYAVFSFSFSFSRSYRVILPSSLSIVIPKPEYTYTRSPFSDLVRLLFLQVFPEQHRSRSDYLYFIGLFREIYYLPFCNALTCIFGTFPVENSFRNYLKDRITLRIFMNLGNLKLTVIPSFTVFLATHANIITSDLQI